MDVSDIVDFNIGTLNSNDLRNSFFCLSKDDPTLGFPFDATIWPGNAYPKVANETTGKVLPLTFMKWLSRDVACLILESARSRPADFPLRLLATNNPSVGLRKC